MEKASANDRWGPGQPVSTRVAVGITPRSQNGPRGSTRVELCPALARARVRACVPVARLARLPWDSAEKVVAEEGSTRGKGAAGEAEANIEGRRGDSPFGWHRATAVRKKGKGREEKGAHRVAAG